MKNIQIRKTIALFLTLVFGVLAVVGFIQGKDIPAPVYAVISMVIGYYFGKSTALEQPTNNQQ